LRCLVQLGITNTERGCLRIFIQELNDVLNNIFSSGLGPGDDPLLGLDLLDRLGLLAHVVALLLVGIHLGRRG